MVKIQQKYHEWREPICFFYFEKEVEMSRRRVTTEIFGVTEFIFIEGLSKKSFEFGDLKNRRFWVFFKIQSSKFLSSGRTERMFFVLSMFLKHREKERLFLKVLPFNFFSSL